MAEEYRSPDGMFRAPSKGAFISYVGREPTHEETWGTWEMPLPSSSPGSSPPTTSGASAGGSGGLILLLILIALWVEPASWFPMIPPVVACIMFIFLLLIGLGFLLTYWWTLLCWGVILLAVVYLEEQWEEIVQPASRLAWMYHFLVCEPIRIGHSLYQWSLSCFHEHYLALGTIGLYVGFLFGIIDQLRRALRMRLSGFLAALLLAPLGIEFVFILYTSIAKG